MKIFPSKRGVKIQDSFFIEEEDIYSDLQGDKGSCLFLGKYSLSEVQAVLKKRSFFKDAQKRGLWPLVFHLDTSEFPIHRLCIFYKEKKEKNLVVDLKIREASLQLKEKLPSGVSLPKLDFLLLEWLTLQNPLLEFSDDESPLPGQKHPGLNLGKKVLDLFVYLARICRMDGLMAFPAYFHNAILFSRHFYFMNPKKQGEVLGIRKTFRRVPFKQLAWMVYWDCLREKSIGTYEWRAEEQVYPLNRELVSYLESKQYKKTARKTREKMAFTVDWECYENKHGSEAQEQC